jgi:hypothetical protein
MTKNTLQDKLFDFVREMVLSQGGDGTVVIVSRFENKLLADHFLKYEKKLEEPYFTKVKSKNDDILIFSNEENSQEGIIFRNDATIGDFIYHENVIFFNTYVRYK